MNIDTATWKNEMDAVTQAFKNAFGQLSEEELNWKPNAQTWSIAQILEHLIIINSSYYPIILHAQQKTLKLSWMGRISFFYNMMGKAILSASQPDRKKLMSTFPIWMPSSSNIPGDILQKFEKHQEDFKQVIDKCQSLLFNNTVIHSPANQMICYKLSTAFDIIVAHEKRHFNQAMELLEMMKPKS